MKVAVIGSCLSNLPAVFLASDFGWTRLNNAATQRSDLFLDQVVRGRAVPPLPIMREWLGLEATGDRLDRYLLENYRDHCGLTEMPSESAGLWRNLHEERFDLILLDNMSDLIHGKLIYRGDAFPSFDLAFPAAEAPNAVRIAAECDFAQELSASESADNWIEILRFVRNLQPGARIVFSSAPFCTAIGDVDRYERALAFHNLFVERADAVGAEVAPPPNVPIALTKLPHDRDHFDMSVYRAMAGHLHISTLSGWRNWRNRPLPQEVMEAEVDHSHMPSSGEVGMVVDSPVELLPVVAAALGLPLDRLGEDAAMNRTERWDSLKQIGLVLAVEEAFGVKLPFKATTEAVDVPAFRCFLLAAGVRAADHVEADDGGLASTPISGAESADATSVVAKTSLGVRQIIAPVDWANAAHDRNLFADFVRRAREAPDAPYMLFVDGEDRRVVSMGEVLAAAASVAARLSHVSPGSLVALVLDHSTHLYAGFIGCVLAGLTPTILAPRTPRQDEATFSASMEELFRRIRPAAVLTAGGAIASVPPGVPDLVDMERLTPVDMDATEALARRVLSISQGREIAFLQHSSGTTGHKKGVMLTHGQVLEQVRLYAASIGAAAGDRVASWLPLYHDMGLITSFILPTVLGCPIVSMDAQEWVVQPGMLLDLIEAEQANFCWLPNFAFLHIARNDKVKARDLRSVQMFVNCSEPCRATAFDVFLERYAEAGVTPDHLQVSYAMAETVFAATQTTAGGPVLRKQVSGVEYLSSGRPLPGVEIEIRDVQGWPVAGGQMGEIWLRSTYLFAGYHLRPDVTAERLIGGWYGTRDLGRLIDGELYVVGRTDDLVIVNGKNIVAHEVEDQIGTIEGLAAGRILIAGDFDETIGTSQLIVLAEIDQAGAPEDVLIRSIRDAVFASTAVSPAIIRLLPRGYLVKSSSGKLAREASLNKWRKGGMSSPEFEA